MTSLALVSRPSLATHLSASIAPRRSKVSATSRREIFTRRNGTLLWDQLLWWPWYRCVVGCKTGQTCIAQVIGSRRPTTLVMRMFAARCPLYPQSGHGQCNSAWPLRANSGCRARMARPLRAKSRHNRVPAHRRKSHTIRSLRRRGRCKQIVEGGEPAKLMTAERVQ